MIESQSGYDRRVAKANLKARVVEAHVLMVRTNCSINQALAQEPEVELRVLLEGMQREIDCRLPDLRRLISDLSS